MTYLSTEDRKRIYRALSRYWSRLFETVSGMSKSDLLAAVVATDEWIDDNEVSYNSSLPNPFKTNATQTQKTVMFCMVALARANMAFVRQIFGEVN